MKTIVFSLRLELVCMLISCCDAISIEASRVFKMFSKQIFVVTRKTNELSSPSHNCQMNPNNKLLLKKYCITTGITISTTNTAFYT